MTPGIGQKTDRTEALELHRERRWPPAKIARALDVDVDQVKEWIYGKARKANTRRVAISEASPEQRQKVKGKACIKCRKHAGQCHPAHLIDRSLGGDDDPRAVVPLCPADHRAYDEEQLDLLPWLEPHYREEIAYAVELVGLMRALHRITGERWAPEKAS
jgi:hypothetical protein